MYSIASRTSFDAVEQHVQHIVDALSTTNRDPIPFVLVGNKVDLESLREVATIEGEVLGLSELCRLVPTIARRLSPKPWVRVHSWR